MNTINYLLIYNKNNLNILLKILYQFLIYQFILSQTNISRNILGIKFINFNKINATLKGKAFK
jgi:hypothetical protein